MTGADRLAAAVAGRSVALEGADARDLLAQARREGLVPLLAHRVRVGGNGDWPPAVRAELDAAAGEQVALEHLQRLELTRLLDGCARAGVRPLLLKGAALAYTVYPDPALRPHDDVDLLVSDDDRPAAARALTALGYTPAIEGGGDLSSSQGHYAFVDRHGVRHACDLHWRIANPRIFRDMVGFAELDEASIPVPALSPHARTLAVHHALFVACVHRVAHHFARDRLLWTYDIHLLVQRATAVDFARLQRLAERAQACAVCARGLDAAAGAFGSPVPATLLSALHAGAARGEPSRAFLTSGLRLVDVLRHDLGALRHWQARAALLAEHLFPSSDYMREAYAPGSRSPLAWLYACRIVRGAPKWFRRPSA